jgi:heme-degrading monooxygenase HmoA
MYYVVANRVYVADEWQAMFEQRFRQRAGEIDKQPGFVRLQIMRPTSAETPYVVLTTWQDEAAFQRWVRSEDFKTAHQNPMPKEAFSAEGRLEQYEVIIEA